MSFEKESCEMCVNAQILADRQNFCINILFASLAIKCYFNVLWHIYVCQLHVIVQTPSLLLKTIYVEIPPLSKSCQLRLNHSDYHKTCMFYFNCFDILVFIHDYKHEQMRVMRTNNTPLLRNNYAHQCPSIFPLSPRGV